MRDETPSGTELAADVRLLIQNSVPTIDALEVLLYVVKRRDTVCTIGEISAATTGPVHGEALILAYLNMLVSQEVLAAAGDTGYVYGAPAPTLAAAVTGLIEAYNERPVTLIRTVYRIADSKNIQSFADAFRLRKQP